MKRLCVVLAILAPSTLAGCGGGPKVVVEAMGVDPATRQTIPLADLPVRLLPYDRDAIFDSLTAASRTPEPVLPPPPAAEASDSAAALSAPNLDSLRAARRAWAATTFAPFDSIARARTKASRRAELADTTDAAGAASFRAEPGRWWIYARYVLPDRELYWNIPLEVGSTGARVRLTPANAESRPLF
jgi:hypothetical protein